jgi:NADH-quinone oxidoreductase subunit J
LEPDLLLFYLFAAVAVGASLMVVGQRNPMHSVMLLILSFVALAGLYVLLDAPFLAVIQIIIYAGAILVLFLFVVMLLNAPKEQALRASRGPIPGPRRTGAFLGVLLLGQLCWAFWEMSRDGSGAAGTLGSGQGTTDISSVRAIGQVLYTDYAFAFEVTSLLILVAMVGAVVLAKRRI